MERISSPGSLARSEKRENGKMKIVVLAGGLSTERNVSLASGTKVCGALRELGHQAVLADVFMGLPGVDVARLFDDLPPLAEAAVSNEAPDLDAVRASRPGDSKSLFGPGILELCGLADLVFIALHGECGEDGRVQAAFDLLGIPYTGSGYRGSAIAMDKCLTKDLVHAHGVPTPDWREWNYTAADIPAIVAETTVPCVVKTPRGGSSIGVTIVKKAEDLAPALERNLAFGSTALIETYIPGRELTCGVLEGKALPSVEIVPKVAFYDYESKYQAGATEEVCPAPIPPEVEAEMGRYAETVHRVLGLKTYSRSDFILGENGKLYFLEVNTLPGMTNTSLVPQEAAAVGISYQELCRRIVNDAVK